VTLCKSGAAFSCSVDCGDGNFGLVLVPLVNLSPHEAGKEMSFQEHLPAAALPFVDASDFALLIPLVSSVGCSF